LDRKQTLVNAERYITEELKEYETQILGAEEKISQIEHQLYRQVCENVMMYIDQIQENSRLNAEFRLCVSLSELAISENYQKPFSTKLLRLILKKEDIQLLKNRFL
jgi:DNA mismatch repair protein MutS